LAFALTADRLEAFDRQQLLTLRSNARRLGADIGPRADEAKALLPLIDAELSKRAPAAAPAKPRAKTAAAAAPAAVAAKPRAKKKA
jgi:hypothetical protein